MKYALLLLLVGCTPEPVRKLPSATRTPAVDLRSSTRACGFDVVFDNQPYESFRYTYDELGRLAGATGSYGEDISYAYDYLDHLVQYVDVANGFKSEQLQAFDTLGDLIDISIESHGPSYDDSQHYVYSELTPTGQPAGEDVTQNGFSAHYLLTYDATDRLVTATLAGGETTTYTYDDDGRTLTIDTANGAFHGVVRYDDRARELSETWGGSDPNAETRSTTYVYAGDQLQTATYVTANGTEIDTMKYRCP